MPKSLQQLDYERQMAENQPVVLAYIRSLVSHADAAEDILQETNTVLVQKADQFKSGSPFTPWACRIAYFQTLAYLRDRNRSRLRYDYELISACGREAEILADTIDDRIGALKSCIAKLKEPQRELIEKRYLLSTPLQTLAQEMGRKADSLKVSLFRIRKNLLLCIERSMNRKTHS